MRKLITLLLLLITNGIVSAQTTTVSGTVTDTNSVAYAGARLTVNLVANGIVQSSLPSQTLTSTGAFAIGLTSTASIPQSGTTYQFVAFFPGIAPPAGTGPQTCTLSNQTVGGATQTINLTGCPAITSGGAGSGVTITTVSGLATVPNKVKGTLASVTDGTSTTDCTVGGGSIVVACQYSGTIWLVASGGGTSNATAASIVTTGLIGYYQALPGETVASLKDYSAAGNNATGTVGTAPTIIAGTGGLACPAAGGVSLPAALNSAVTIQIMFSYQPGGLGSQFYAPVIGSASANSIGIGISQGANRGTGGAPPNPTALSNTIGSFSSAFSNVNLLDSPTVFVAGTEDIALVMSATSGQDSMYINGYNLGVTGGTLLGAQTAGNYQLCGGAANATLAVQSWFQNPIYIALFYSTALTPAQIYQNHTAMVNSLLARGIPYVPYRNDTADAIWAAGDSTTAGNGFIGWPSRIVGFNGSWNPINRGISGINAASVNSLASPIGDAICSTAGGRTALMLMTGYNDSVAPTIFGNARGTLQARKFPNCSKPVPIIADMWDGSAGNNALKNAYNLLVRTNCASMADYCIDIGGTVALGADNAASSATYFQGGGPHPTQAGADVVAWVFQRGINRYFGNHDPTTANVYVSAAAAATTLTAATESTNTMTFTAASIPASWLGACVVVTGVTPAGYNSTFANSAGLGCWYVLSVTATTFTAFNFTTGLGAGTVFGTASVPQMVDADQYYIVNFGAGNTTLESCEGLTIPDANKYNWQYIQNINGVASTLVPFGSQTITGTAAPTTLAANTTAILVPQLVSPSAAGCNWLRIQ